jgi:hypothetical protein
MSKKYHTFEFVLKRLLKNPHKYTCIFENRPTKYKFGTYNYGEIPMWYNRADGDPWDIFAPGYKYKLEHNVPYVIDKIIGVYFLENGNHKIAVRLKHLQVDSQKYEKEIINKYTKKYTHYTKIRGQYLTPALVKNIL